MQGKKKSRERRIGAKNKVQGRERSKGRIGKGGRKEGREARMKKDRKKRTEVE